MLPIGALHEYKVYARGTYNGVEDTVALMKQLMNNVRVSVIK